MIIPITIGYDKGGKVVEDLVELDHLLVRVSKKQLKELCKDKGYRLLSKSDNYDVTVVSFDSKSKNEMYLNCKMLEHFVELMEERYEMLILSKCRKIAEYNKINDRKMGHVVLLTLGLPGKGYDKGSKIKKLITKLLMLGRGVGVHVICITDTLDVYPKYWDANFLNKISATNDVDSDYFWGDEELNLKENELAFESAKHNYLKILKYKK